MGDKINVRVVDDFKHLKSYYHYFSGIGEDLNSFSSPLWPKICYCSLNYSHYEASFM